MPKRLNSVFVVPGFTFFYWGFTLPKREYEPFIKCFRLGRPNLVKEIKLKVQGKWYSAKIRLARITTKKFPNREVVQIFYDRNYDTLKALRKLFIYSYATTINKKRPKLKEIMELVHEGDNKFHAKPFAKQETDFDEMFHSMEERNLFGYWQNLSRGKQLQEFFVSFSKKWIQADKLHKFKGVNNVIYILHNSNSNQVYVGKANRLTDRVKKGEGRVGLDKDWDEFMYFEVDPKYNHLLEQIEAFMIRAYSALLPNKFKIVPLKDKTPVLVNRSLRQK